ncbi:MAG TPA: VWA domain-containing protein [Candidatus Saccharimonadales bacterium]|nr:VWA domain-containing protein [Candidatus Saccharimonadales bacterium]
MLTIRLSLFLVLLAIVCPAGQIFAQSAQNDVQSPGIPAQAPDSKQGENSPNTSPAEGGTAATASKPQTAAPSRPTGSSEQESAAGEAPAPNVVLPPAMASKSKVPNETNYDEVHVKPMVKSSEAAKFNPNSAAAAEGEMDQGLRTHTKPIRVDVDLVLVPVTITDPMNRLVTGLEKENFVLLDNGEKQAIQHFSSEDAPISLGVVFDMSGSMSNKIEKARDAVVEFFKTANPEDEFFLIAFNDKPTLLCDFTTRIEEVQGQLIYATPKGRTALLDAVYLGMAKMREGKHQKKALLIISDGGDNRSRYTENEIKSMVKEADVQIYAIGIFDSSPRSDEERFGPQLLAEVTDVTGGRTFTVDNPNELADVATKIGVELRNQYILGYRPTRASHDGKWRKLKVKLNTPKGLPQLSVYAKTGYYAPSE